MIECILKLESVLTPDIFIRVHRVSWNQRPVPFAQAVRQLVRLDQIPEGLLRYRGGNYLIGDPSFMGKTVSLMVCLHDKHGRVEPKRFTNDHVQVRERLEFVHRRIVCIKSQKFFSKSSLGFQISAKPKQCPRHRCNCCLVTCGEEGTDL